MRIYVILLYKFGSRWPHVSPSVDYSFLCFFLLRIINHPVVELFSS